jgi:hypothetical protein
MDHSLYAGSNVVVMIERKQALSIPAVPAGEAKAAVFVL